MSFLQNKETNYWSIVIKRILKQKFKQKGNDLKILGNDNVRTLLLNINKDDFLANYPDNLEKVPAVEIDLI